MAAIVLMVAAILVFLPGAFTRWVLPKETVLIVAVVCASLARASGRIDRTTWLFVGTGLGWLAITALLGEAPLAQLFGRWPRYEGLVSLPVYIAALWVGARMFGPSRDAISRISLLNVAIAWGSITLFLVSLLEAVGLRPIPSDLERPGALLGNATDQGIIASVFAVMTLSSFVALSSGTRGAARGRRLLFASAACASILTVALSGSRAGVLALATALVVAFALLLFLPWSQRPDTVAALRRHAVWGLGGAAALSTIAFLGLPQIRGRLLGVSDFAAQTIGDRLMIWQETLGIIVDHPWTGVGPSGFADAVARAHGPDWYSSADPGTVLDSPHSAVLQVVVAGGLPLLLLGAIFTIWAASRVWRSFHDVAAYPHDRWGIEGTLFRFAAVGALAGVAAAWLTHFPVAATATLAGVLLGNLIANDPTVESRIWRRIRTALLGVWVGLLAIATAAEVALMSGLEAPTAPAAHASFSAASVLRPWDADISSLAAQAMTARADAGQFDATALAVEWGERAVNAAPENAPARLALGVALRLDGRSADSVSTLKDLAEVIPLDPDVAVQYGISLAASGEFDRARAELMRAHRLRPLDPSIGDLLSRLERAH